MTIDQPFDVSSVPELARLVEEVRLTRRPRVLRRANEDVALLTPLPAPSHHRRPGIQRRTEDALAVVARTAGALQGDIPFPGIEAEREAVEQLLAADVAREG